MNQGNQKTELQEELIFDYKSWIDSMVRAIEKSSLSVDLCFYIFQTDSIGYRVIQALKSALFRGVRVRVRVDGLGSVEWISELEDQLREIGVEFQIYHPFWNVGFWNKRDHRKLVVVDQKIAFLGSANLTASHINWFDVMMRIEGERAKILSDHFENVWKKKRKWLSKRKVRPYASWLHSNETLFLRVWERRLLLKKIKNAKDQIVFATPYFLPTKRVYKEILRASQRGVRVQILLPEVSDVPWSDLVSKVMIEKLIAYGVEFYFYFEKVLHAKCIWVDSWWMVGSLNMNHRSFHHDLELNYSPESPSLFRDLRKTIFHLIQTKSKGIAKRSRLFQTQKERLIAQFLFLFRSYF